MRVLLFTRSLDTGGAERQLVLLAKTLHSRGVPVAVMVYYGNGPFRSELDDAGVAVINIGKSGRWDVIRFAFRVVQSIRQFEPDVIYSFMGANIIATCLKSFFGGAKVVWGVRSSDMDLSQYDWLSRLFDRFAIGLSRFAAAIICNSERGREHIIRQGYANSAITVIHNGIDLDRFMHTASSRQARLSGWGVPGESLGIQHSVHWVGHSSEPFKDYSAFDVLVSSSMTEAFPNVIGEAMACGVPVVATDVGDCGRIVCDCGWIVPPKKPEALAAAIGQAIAALPNWPAQRSRKRIQENFSVDAMADQTLSVLDAAVKS